MAKEDIPHTALRQAIEKLPADRRKGKSIDSQNVAMIMSENNKIL